MCERACASAVEEFSVHEIAVLLQEADKAPVSSGRSLGELLVHIIIVLQAREKIIEDMLTLKCPRQHCRNAFVDFDACFALTCNVCSCAFCVYCLHDCGRDVLLLCNYTHTQCNCTAIIL